MKKITKKNVCFCIMVLILAFGHLNAQFYQVGDLVQFPDGTQGVVFYISPDDPGKGSAVALADLPQSYPLWDGESPDCVQSFAMRKPSLGYSTNLWQYEGKPHTVSLMASEVPLAAVLGDGRGWYVPDVMQMRMVYGMVAVLKSAVETVGGEFQSLLERGHWTSSRGSVSWFGPGGMTSQMGMYWVETSGKMNLADGTEEHFIRLVRDFGEDAYGYWVDSPANEAMTVHPDTTATYEARVIFRSDTFPLSGTVTVKASPAPDTIFYEISEAMVEDGSVTVACRTVSGITGIGTYTFCDTLVSASGCDSVVTLALTVEAADYVRETWYRDTLCPLREDYYFAPFDTLFQFGTLPGMYVHHGTKVVDGREVDTTAYLDLVILPEYERRDTLAFCVPAGEAVATMEVQPGITVMVDGQDGLRVTVRSALGDVLGEKYLVGNYDMALQLQTAAGCDSMVYLHFNWGRGVRDTVRRQMSVMDVAAGQVTVDSHTFVGIDGPGTYIYTDTLVSVNGCDSIVTLELVVMPCAVDFSVVCPADVRDTLAFGDCVMRLYPEQFGTPTVVCKEEWPFVVSNDLPEDMLFAEGEHRVTWVATDAVCGLSDTCEQMVTVVFPQCPDAVDCEGNVYHGVRIGCDCWTQRNLESLKYSDCEDIEEVCAYASWRHPDTLANVNIFGRLYRFAAAVRDSADNGFGHIQGVCPEGWYLPTPEKYAGLNEYGAAALKSPMFWFDGGGDNSTGFTALPAGRYNGERLRFEGMLTEAYFWSSRGVATAAEGLLSLMRYQCDSIIEQAFPDGMAFSVRCIKEREARF